MNTVEQCQSIHAALLLGTNVDMRTQWVGEKPDVLVRFHNDPNRAEAAQSPDVAAPVRLPIDRQLARCLGWMSRRPGVTAWVGYGRNEQCFKFGTVPGRGVLRIEMALWDKLGRDWPFDRINARRRRDHG